jgi:phosphomethylpyrimidine synthase
MDVARIFLSRRNFSEGGCSMKITEDVRKYAAEQKLSDEEALRAGMEQKAREFTEAGAEIYSKA